MRRPAAAAPTLAAALSFTAIVAADQPPPGTYYAVNIYGIPGGEGRALVIGPIHQENCARTKPMFVEAAGNLPVPPNMPLQISTCITQADLTQVLYAPFNCTPVDNQKLPRSPGVRIWVYYCHWL